ncbi:MAG TPA: tetratricopeptide repeat protein, partial [Acidimicrobiia bacterium]|nr:tetratricopeptide repeat protein [Acidimicrobiia bacterium]
YHLARSVLRAVIGATPSSPPQEIATRLRTELEATLGEDAAVHHTWLSLLLDLPLEEEAARHVHNLDPEVVRKQTHRSLGDYLEAKARHRPQLLVWEDLHWSDPSSLQALSDVLDVTTSTPLMILLTHRPEPQAAIRGFPAANGVTAVGTIELRPLTEAESRRLMANLLQIDEVAPQTREAIAAKAEGNPFFLEEILRDLIDQGAIVHSEGRWRAGRPLEDLGVPDTIEGLIGTRIDRLSEEDKRTLQVASVVGRTFSIDVASQVACLDGASDDIEASLAELTLRQLIVPAGEARTFSFKHALTQDAAYAGMLRTRRRRLHRHTAEVMESYGSGKELAPVLARHFDLGGVADRAVHYLELAGRQAAAVYANEEAIRFFSRALELTDDPQHRFELLGGRADMYGLLARRDEQRADIDAMLELAEAGADPTLRIDALRHLVSYYLVTEYLEAEPPLEEALRLATQIDDRKRRGLLLEQLARFHRLQYRHPRAVEALTEALGLFEQEGLDLEVARTLAALTAAYAGAGEPAEARSAALRAIQVAQEVGDPRVEAEARRFSVIALRGSGRHQEALDDGLEALRLARQIGDQEMELSTLNFLGAAYKSLGRPDDAEGAFLQATELAASIGHHVGWLSGAMSLVEMWEAMGRIQDGLDWLTGTLPLVEGRGETHNVSYVHYALGYRFLRWLGDYEQSLEHVEAALALIDGDDWQPPRVMYRNARATLLSSLGRHAEAIATIDEARSIAEEHRMRNTFTYLYATQARVYLGRNHNGDLARARRHATELLEAASGERMLRGQHQEALVLLARIDLAENRPADALDKTNQAVALLEGIASVERPVSPQEVWYVHALALESVGKTDEATEAVGRGRALVEEQAATITDERLRDSCLSVEVNRAILEWGLRG